MSKDDIEAIAEEAADKAIHRLFLTLGIDVTDSKDVIALQADLKHVRVWRESTKTVKDHALRTAIGVIVAGGLGWIGLLFWKGH
jgi:hypothetical protein